MSRTRRPKLQMRMRRRHELEHVACYFLRQWAIWRGEKEQHRDPPWMSAGARWSSAAAASGNGERGRMQGKYSGRRMVDVDVEEMARTHARGREDQGGTRQMWWMDSSYLYPLLGVCRASVLYSRRRSVIHETDHRRDLDGVCTERGLGDMVCCFCFVFPGGLQ